MNHAVEDGIGNRTFPNHFVPLGYRKLGTYDSRFSIMSVFYDFQQDHSGCTIQWCQTKIIKDQQIIFFDPADFANIRSISLSIFNRVKSFWVLK